MAKEQAEAMVIHQIEKGLQKTIKEMPFFLLYNKEGSELYEQITKLEDYYPFQAEKALLQRHASEISAHIHPQSILVELGCGTAQKTVHLLDAVQSRLGSCHFIGIDVSKSALDDASALLERELRNPKAHKMEFIQADLLEGLKEVRRQYPERTLCILWLGSSIGNLSQTEAISFLNGMTHAAGSCFQFLLFTDMWKDQNRLFAAYKDDYGVTERFIKNGVKNMLHILGRRVSAEEEKAWIYQVEINEQLRQVEMYVCFPFGLQINGDTRLLIRPGERVRVEISRKFTTEDIYHLAYEARYHVHASWRDSIYDCQMLLPAEAAFLDCWNDTDDLFSTISDWTEKPIPYRHCYGFYYGHVAAFSKLKLFPEQSISHFDEMFSRGIDPIITEPSKCHSHPEIPAEWPDKDAIVRFVKQTRERILEALKSSTISMKLQSLVLEHERMHHETLQYMITQERRRKFESNPHAQAPNHTIHQSPSQNPMTPPPDPDVFVPAGQVTLGADANNSVRFLWDNESPIVHKTVEQPFWVSSTPVTIHQFLRFVVEGCYEVASLWDDPSDFNFFREQRQRCPRSWSLVGGEYFIHTLYETKHWSEVADDPVFVSLAEAEAFCRWHGWRVMTEAEYQRVLDHCRDGGGAVSVQRIRDGGWEWTSSVFDPFPGFKEMREYPQYSADFFDGCHYVLKGSSPATHPSLIRDSFRNFYQRQYPYAFAKFRCCR